ncbi:MAG: TolC family protein [Burkholderiales bacterium]
MTRRSNTGRPAGVTESRAGRLLALALAAATLAGCAITPVPLEPHERELLAADSHAALFAGQEPLARPLTLEEATARAIKYQADYRQRQMEQAAAEAQIDVARFDLLPRLTMSAGYTTRDNEAFGFGFSPSGQIAANPSASTERTRDTMSLGLAWNLLDFGVSYFRARQTANQTLIAAERRRKAIQTLMHDVRVAWWRAEAAQRLLPYADDLLAEIDRAIEKTRAIEIRKLLPPLQTATLRRALLDLSQQIAFRRQELAQSKVELAALVNLPPGSDVQVASPPGDAREAPDLVADVDRLEALALRTRPEIPEEGYRARISEDEARKAIVSLIPGLSLDFAGNSDSNRFLVNNTWTSAGINVIFNLVKVFSVPALNRSEEAQKKVDEARRLAMAMAIVAQTRVAAVRYRLVADEFAIWDEASRDDDLIVKYLASSSQAGVDSELELIRAKARAGASRMNRDLAYAGVQASMARLFHSVGYDAVPRDAEAGNVADLARLMRARFSELESASFVPRAEPPRPAVALTRISGVPDRVSALLREGARRVLDISKVRAAQPGSAEVEVEITVKLALPVEGRVDAHAAVRLVRKAGGPALQEEFKTALSDPVDDEQWRVFGEGALYRVLGELVPPRSRSPSARRAPAPTRAVRSGTRVLSELDGAPLALRMDPALRSPVPGSISSLVQRQ